MQNDNNEIVDTESGKLIKNNLKQNLILLLEIIAAHTLNTYMYIYNRVHKEWTTFAL